jgi:hypothetical protein
VREGKQQYCLYVYPVVHNTVPVEYRPIHHAIVSDAISDENSVLVMKYDWPGAFMSGIIPLKKVFSHCVEPTLEYCSSGTTHMMPTHSRTRWIQEAIDCTCTVLRRDTIAYSK